MSTVNLTTNSVINAEDLNVHMNFETSKRNISKRKKSDLTISSTFNQAGHKRSEKNENRFQILSRVEISFIDLDK
jgi:hypothetical protein